MTSYGLSFRFMRAGVLAQLGQWQRMALLLSMMIFFFQLPCTAEQPIKIGVSLGLTGRFDVISGALNRGFKLWEQNVNNTGGILGRPVQVIVKDDRSDPDHAVSLYREFIEMEQVDFLFAPYSSLITEAVLPIVEKNDMPLLIAGAAADRLWENGYRNAIGVYTPASKFAVGFLELLVLNDLDKITVVYSDDPFSVDLAKSIKKWARRFGLNIVDFQSFKKGTLNLEPLALITRQNKSQVLMVCGHMDEAIHMSNALKKIDWRPKAFYASVGPALQGFYDQCGPEVEAVFGTSLWEPRANYPGAQEFNQQFTETYGTPPGYHAGLAYAAGQVLKKAVDEVGSIDKGKVRRALFDLDTMTIIGRFGIDKTGKQLRQHTFIIQWQNGHKELVWPDQIKTAEPKF
ncbi:amino acid ABC transporter substrate-binding protein [Desulfobacula sp.]|uniref:amino acid ABC transporter substrate-binding protein n=1 Tax=Desulfobacula sp. TaxID=2593537 RepID=UPI0026066DBE|nr:amino acid ABC transporter substrate-binding protein [Desulfobacula sp.]